MSKGYYRIQLAGVASLGTPNNRTGEQRLAKCEAALRKQGIPFVEDFDTDNTVILRYGAYCDDRLWDVEVRGIPVTDADIGETEAPLSEHIICPDCGNSAHITAQWSKQNMAVAICDYPMCEHGFNVAIVETVESVTAAVYA